VVISLVNYKHYIKNINIILYSDISFDAVSLQRASTKYYVLYSKNL